MAKRNTIGVSGASGTYAVSAEEDGEYHLHVYLKAFDADGTVASDSIPNWEEETNPWDSATV